jgi:hypothetical protein
MRLSLRSALGALVLGLAAAPAAAGTITAGATRLVFGGEFIAAVGPRDLGYFNFTSYSSSSLRQARLALDAELRHGDRLALVGAVRTINAETPVVSALYLRLRPVAGRVFDVQVGRIPPVFGSFARRGYGSGNLLVGLPLAYQYLTTVRPDALPASADELLRWRGGGWRPGYAGGSQVGLPLVQGDLWDTGVEARLGSGERWQFAAALTQGTLAHPRVRDDNGGKQLSARLSRRFGHALAAGVSAARGAYLARDAHVPPGGAPRGAGDAQRALGFDVEYARGHALARAEAVWSAWDVPSVRERPLGAWSASVECRLRLAPALDAAARVERLSFDVIRGATRRDTWDAPVWRVETGLGFSLRRGVRLKAVYQHNWRDGGYVRREGFAVAQLGVRF